MKYYHPDVAEGKFDMMEEFSVLLNGVLHNNQYDKYLFNWSAKFNDDYPVINSNDNSSGIVLSPNLDWINDEPFSGLKTDLHKLINAKRPEHHHYFELAKGIGNPIFKNDDNFPSLDYTNDLMKLYGLASYWNKIEYFFPYKYLIDSPWDSVLEEFISKMIESDTPLDYKLTLIELFGSISDTHANLWVKDQALTKFWGEKSLPLKITFINNQAVIMDIYFDQLKGKTNLQKGDVLVEIEGISVEKLTREKIKYSPASNRDTQLRDVSGKLLRTNNDSVEITILRKGKRSTETMNCVDANQMPNGDPKPSSRMLDKHNIGYLFPGSLKEGEIDSLMQSFMKTDGLIIDFRCYPSDFIVFSLGKYLMPQPTEFVKFSFTSYQNPGRFQFSSPLKVGELNPDYYKGKTVIIVNEITQSSAEYHTMAFRMAPNSTVIGSQTAGSDGNVSGILMPGFWRTMISGIGVYYPDGTETQRIGIVPDIEYKPTISGIKRNEDKLLEKAIQIINESTSSNLRNE